VLPIVVVVSLAVPALGRPRDEQRAWPRPERTDIVRMLAQFVVRALGDGLTVPRP
jgi:hypothetical protein